MKKHKAAYLQVTRNCNNECIFCSNPQFERDYSFDEAKAQVLDFKKEGVTEIILTGGEPTLCTFLPTLVEFIREQGMDLKIISNGVKLSEKSLVRRLSNAGLDYLHISIHSHDEKISDALSRKKGHWRKTLKGIRNCLKEGMHVNINSTINSKNCTYLSKFIGFMIEGFPKIQHYVFNGLDPGKADGRLKSRAGRNPRIVPKLTDLELELKKTVELLKKNNKTFRIERIPLCYMRGFEEFSTETRKIVKDESYICSFIRRGTGNEVRRVKPSFLRRKAECCKYCNLNSICAGIQKEYVKLYGTSELYPVFNNPKKIAKKMLGIT